MKINPFIHKKTKWFMKSEESVKREELREKQKEQEKAKDYKGAHETAKEVLDSIKKEQDKYKA